MRSEDQLRDWIKMNGLSVGRRRFEFTAAEFGLPHFDEPPQAALPGFDAELAKTDVPFRVDLIGWQLGSKEHPVALAELKMGPARRGDIGQIVSYMHYFSWLQGHLGQANLAKLASKAGHPELAPTTPIIGLLVAADFDYDLWWSVPPLRKMTLVLVRHDIVKEIRGDAKGIRDVHFLDFTAKMRAHWG